MNNKTINFFHPPFFYYHHGQLSSLTIMMTKSQTYNLSVIFSHKLASKLTMCVKIPECVYITKSHNSLFVTTSWHWIWQNYGEDSFLTKEGTPWIISKLYESWQQLQSFWHIKIDNYFSMLPFPLQSHWTKPSGDAPMYGISLLITKPLKSQLKFPWYVCCSSMHISLALISYYLPWFKEATLMLEFLYWPRICLIR